MLSFNFFLCACLSSCALLMVACKSSKYEDPFRIQLRKTTCKGTCPAYLITITNDKQLVFDGQSFTKVEGLHTATLSKQEYDSLRLLLKQSQFFELDAPKDTKIMDISFTYLEVLEGNKQRKLKFANQIPPPLQPLLVYLQELAAKRGFVQQE